MVWTIGLLIERLYLWFLKWSFEITFFSVKLFVSVYIWVRTKLLITLTVWVSYNIRLCISKLQFHLQQYFFSPEWLVLLWVCRRSVSWKKIVNFNFCSGFQYYSYNSKQFIRYRNGKINKNVFICAKQWLKYIKMYERITEWIY